MFRRAEQKWFADEVLSKLGTVKQAYVTGDYAKGIDSGIIDLVLVGDTDRWYLGRLSDKVEEIINRKIRPLVLKEDELAKPGKQLKIDKALIVWGG